MLYSGTIKGENSWEIAQTLSASTAEELGANRYVRVDDTPVGKLAILVIGGVIAPLSGCNREQPVPRTEEYYALHGLVPGQVNELQIGEYRFRFPVENFPEPYTYAKRAGDVVKGKADQATVYLAWIVHRAGEKYDNHMIKCLFYINRSVKKSLSTPALLLIFPRNPSNSAQNPSHFRLLEA